MTEGNIEFILYQSLPNDWCKDLLMMKKCF